MLEMILDTGGHEQLKRELTPYLRALWGGDFQLRFAESAQLLRGAFDGREQVLPALPHASPRLTRARASHAAAHARFSGEPCDPGGLKPLQRVLASLFEDARVEALAIAQYPGLRGLWAPFHHATPSPRAPLTAVLARLSRALFDRDYHDPDAWIQKGCALFWVERASWQSRELSRRLGSLLGNDLGQMRLPFDAGQYVVEPLYRDDHSGLWQQPARLSQEAPRAGEAAERELSLPGNGVHRYPEWDYLIGKERPVFCELSVLEAPSMAGSEACPIPRREASRAQRCLRRLLLTPRWQRRCFDGPELDLAAAVDAAALSRVERASARIYRRRRPKRRDSSTLLLLDLSESSNARLASGLLARQLACAVARVLCVAFARVSGLELAIRGFNSYGRKAVRYARFKDFAETAEVALRRLGALPASGSTRLGPALRHATSELSSRPGASKLLLVVTDGDPADVDVYDDEYLVADARRAVNAARRAGVRVFACCLPGGPRRSCERVFGVGQATLADLSTLPRLLERAYAELPAER